MLRAYEAGRIPPFRSNGPAQPLFMQILNDELAQPEMRGHHGVYIATCS
jgi:hypothetical protein